MTDRELLEKAAKAAGLGDVWYIDGFDTPYIGPPYSLGTEAQYSVWNPLTDDGDALRLAVKRRFHTNIFSAREGMPGFVEVWHEDGGDPLWVEYVEDGDYLTATRRAIVRAAAALAG